MRKKDEFRENPVFLVVSCCENLPIDKFVLLYYNVLNKTKESEVQIMDNNDNEIMESGEEVEIIDLDGEPFAVIGELEHEGEIYFALIPDKEEEDEEDELEFVILKEAEENGEHFLVTIDDDSHYEKIGEIFLKMFADSAEDAE
jgi:uncharacterized protein YrzB (UPF0473 family)